MVQIVRIDIPAIVTDSKVFFERGHALDRYQYFHQLDSLRHRVLRLLNLAGRAFLDQLK
jgi:hypothetical protein